VQDAEPAFAALLAEGRAAPAMYPLLTSCYMLGMVQQVRGELTAALRTFREGLGFAPESGRVSLFHAGEAHIGIAQVLYQRNRLQEALPHATQGVELCRQVIELTELDLALVTLGWIRHAMGETAAALDAMNEACRAYPRPDAAGLGYPAECERARLLLTLGRVEDAARWVQDRGLTEDVEVAYALEPDLLLLARLHLAQSQPNRALELLQRLDTLAESQRRMGSLIEVRAVRSLALQATGDHEGALSVLAGALELARPEGYIRVFADEGPPMAALLRSLLRTRPHGGGQAAADADTDYLLQVLRAFGPAPVPARSDDPRRVARVTGLVESLTERELEVLRLLAAGSRNRDIARELVVTLETVKKHTSHIYRKLGAANRTEAVAHARILGLIS
jgi:LuxR family maltose regulon positive regulatory protein